MQTFTIATIIASLAVFANAELIKAPRGAGIQARSANIRLCTDQSFGGCSSFTVPTGVCWNFPGNLNDKVSSLDTGGGPCTFFFDGSCGGISYVTSGAQPTVPTNFNDALSSLNCA